MGTQPPTRRNRAKGTAAAAALLLAAGAAPSSGPLLPGPPTHPFRARPFQDSNWGGYVVQGSFTTVSGSWVEPKATCGSTNDLFAPWVGLDGFGSQTVEQTGVQTDCSSGRPVRSAWYEMYPALPVYWKDPVSQGDHMTATVVANGGGGYTLTLSDDTRGWSEHVDQTLKARDASAEAVVESPTQSYPAFRRLDFSGVRVDGQLFDAYHPTALDSGGYVPAPLSRGSFSVAPGGGFTARTQHGGRHATRPRVIRYGGAPAAPPPAPPRACLELRAGRGSATWRLRIQGGGGRRCGTSSTDDNAGDGVARPREPGRQLQTGPRAARVRPGR